MIAYARFGNAKVVEELRVRYNEIEQELADQNAQLQELWVQNKILKSRAQQLLDQNEDYSKVISQLSRYYFRLKQTHEKLKEISQLVAVVEEEDLAKKMDSRLSADQPSFNNDDTTDGKTFF